MRILHFSDPHVPVPFSVIPLKEMLNKRLLGALNTQLRRLKKFARAREKLEKLDVFRREQGIDLVLCTGDYTVLGSDAEYAVAKAAVAPLMDAPLGYVHVPGNHDLYLPDTVEQRRFERTFSGTLDTDCPEYRTDDTWPIVRLVGNDVAVVAINSARPNPAVWRSSGRVPQEQVATLPRILSDERLINRFVFLLTHYGLYRANGTPDEALHGMENADELLLACAALRRGALLHGHIHHSFHLEIPGRSFETDGQVVGRESASHNHRTGEHAPTTGASPEARDEGRSTGNLHVFNAGSTTYEGREGLWVFDIEGSLATATRGRFDRDHYVLDTSEIYEL